MQTENHAGHSSQMHESMHHSRMSYINLLIMAVLSFITMYILMYAMVNTFENVVPNINQFYMAGLMASPMVTIELILMRKMYANKKLNIILIVLSIILLLLFYFAIRNQAAVKDKQFLRSMIPHHAGAILMVKEAELSDPEVQQLAKDIIESQQKEIDFMKSKLQQLKGN